MLSVKGSTCLHSFAVGPIGQLGRALLQPGLALRRWQRNRHAIAALQTLDARMLKDMGIERSEIESVVRGLGRDASRLKRT